jgi:alkyl hydroperoxide reductase subunit AhpC
MLSTIGIGLLVVGLIPGAEDGSKTPEQQFQALKHDYDAAFQAFVKAQTDPEAAPDVLVRAGKNPRSFAGGFMALAKKHPGTQAAEDALVWVTSHVIFGPETEEAKRLLTQDHIRSSKLAPIFAFQWITCGSKATERLLREAMVGNPNREIQGLARYWLARYLVKQAQWSREARGAGDKVLWVQPHTMIPPNPIVVVGWGADYVDRVRRLDSQALDGEAETLLARVIETYADIPNNDKNQRREAKTLGDAARADLHEMQRLAIGKPAPDIKGQDLEGRPFRLGDYRGKVVVLNFGSLFFCGFCRTQYPHDRSLVERLEGRPFALVSINAEPTKNRAELKAAWKAAGNTWRCVWDGDYEGPINVAWNIREYPTIYVLDPQGVIRYKNVFGKDLERAVSSLLEDMQAENGASR